MDAKRFMLPLALAASLLTSGAHASGKLYRCDDLANRAQLSALDIAVYQGDEGWFFRESDLNHFYMISPETLRFLGRLRDVLALHGIQLVLMPLPPKSVLAANHAIAATDEGQVLFDPEFARSEFEVLLRTLKQGSLVTADVLEAIASTADLPPGDFYFARDVHWRPKLAMASAEAVRRVLLETGGEGVLGTKSFTTRLADTGPNESKTVSTLNQICADPIPGESMDFYVTQDSAQSLDAFLGDGDAPPPVAVVGTSFTDEANPYNFAGFLREELQNDVATYAISGGGVDTALYKWANDGLAATSGARILVWELPFPERLEEISPQLEREIIPAIAGICSDENLLQATGYTLDANGTATVAIDSGIKASGNGFYVAASLSDPSLRTAAVTFTHADGRADIVPIVRPARVGAAPNMFAELTPAITADLVSVTLHNLTAMPVSGTLSLCTYPKGMWSSAPSDLPKETP
jgi:alginate biosynthesis protein AlgX